MRPSLLAGLVIGLVLSGIAWAILTGIPSATWEAMARSTCLATDTCFCERVHLDESLRQPANTVSSFGFVLVGAWIAAASLLLTSSQRLSSLYGVALGSMTIIVGLGSAYYHASLTFTGQFFDILGMYLTASFVLMYALERLYGLTSRTAVIGYLGINLILTIAQIVIPDLRRSAFAIVLVVGLLVEFVYLRRKPPLNARWLAIGLSLFALAYGIWMLDNSHTLCAPEHWLQGHAIWHVLGAISTGCLFIYYCSEASISKSPNMTV